MNNPNITSHDQRILELDQIVQEVKESEEWAFQESLFREYGL